MTLDNLEDEHSTRNARLMRMMEDMHVVENRGSGISAMLHAMREANLESPRFDDRRASFNITLHNHTLMTREAIKWLNQYAEGEGNTERLCRGVINAGKEVYTFQSSNSSCLIRSGAKTVGSEEQEIASLCAIDRSGLSVD